MISTLVLLGVSGMQDICGPIPGGAIRIACSLFSATREAVQIYVARSTEVRSASLVACFRRQGKLFGYVVLSPAEQSFAFSAGTGANKGVYYE
jgi:hypothetical protein